MSYIAAHIVFDKSELKSVDIVDKNHVFTTDTLENIINNGLNTDFYIKIIVEECDGPSNDCFGLSDGTYYRLNFDQTPHNKQNSITEFNDLIVKALSALSPKKSVSIEKFKQLIVDVLSIKSGSEAKTEEKPVVTEAKTEEKPVVTQEKKLETNPQINDGKTYFIKSTKKPALTP